MSSRLVQPPGAVPLHRVLWGSLKPRYWIAAGVAGGFGFLFILFVPLPFFVRLCVALPPVLVVLAMACPWRGKQLDVWLMEALDFHWRALCYTLVKPRGGRAAAPEEEEEEGQGDVEDNLVEQDEEVVRPAAPTARGSFAGPGARSQADAPGWSGEAEADLNSLGPLWRADGSAAYGKAGVFMRGIQRRLASAGFTTTRYTASSSAQADLAYQPGFGWYDAGGMFLSDQSGRSPVEEPRPHPAAMPAGKRRRRA